ARDHAEFQGQVRGGPAQGASGARERGCVAYDQAKRGLHHHVDAASRFVLRTNE
ncbi:unnamed protein product, partial [Ectocarpus fasciculatus]